MQFKNNFFCSFASEFPFGGVVHHDVYQAGPHNKSSQNIQHTAHTWSEKDKSRIQEATNPLDVCG